MARRTTAGSTTAAPPPNLPPTLPVTPAASARGRGDDDRSRPLFVLVGGVPGAGKSTALARVATGARGVVVLDSESARHLLRARFPALPYPVLRPAVHAWHAGRVLGAVLAGRRGGASAPAALLVHDPATRSLRRGVVASLARACGWSPVLVVLDVGRDDARRGQRERGRVVRGRAFARHWRRWERQRAGLVRAAGSGAPADGWDGVHVVDRRSAPAVLASLVGR